MNKNYATANIASAAWISHPASEPTKAAPNETSNISIPLCKGLRFVQLPLQYPIPNSVVAVMIMEINVNKEIASGFVII